MPFSPKPLALFFDVFGTCVDWRTTVTHELSTQSHASLNSATASLASTLRLRASNLTLDDWGTFAQQWRNSYKTFTRQLAADPGIPWVSVDEHHLSSLKSLVTEWGLEGLWSEEQLGEISMVWHRLEGWGDAARGVEMLNGWCCMLYPSRFDVPLSNPIPSDSIPTVHVMYPSVLLQNTTQLTSPTATSTLSNGNLTLLTDLRNFTAIPFTHLLSAEQFGTYKPAPEVYLGAAARLSLEPAQCAMVAAHLNDLQAAKKCGFMTVYVEREGEEDWGVEDVERARRERWVDVWVRMGEGGFVGVVDRVWGRGDGSGGE